MNMHVLDIAVLALLALGTALGAVRGLSRQLADLLRTAGAVVLAWLLYEPAGRWIHDVTRGGSMAPGPEASLTAGFLLVFLGAFAVLSLLRLALRHVMSFAFRGPIERLGGLVAGASKAAVLAFLFLFALRFWPSDEVRRAVRDDAVAGRMAERVLPAVREQIVARYPDAANWRWDAPEEDPAANAADGDEAREPVDDGWAAPSPADGRERP
jgi:uncharacterized membrane protein required for colicin V production